MSSFEVPTPILISAFGPIGSVPECAAITGPGVAE